jgi:hypothetical protein
VDKCGVLSWFSSDRLFIPPERSSRQSNQRLTHPVIDPSPIKSTAYVFNYRSRGAFLFHRMCDIADNSLKGFFCVWVATITGEDHHTG